MRYKCELGNDAIVVESTTERKKEVISWQNRGDGAVWKYKLVRGNVVNCRTVLTGLKSIS